MTDKLTPRQNEIISDALCRIACDLARQQDDKAPERIKEYRRALVSECEAVTAETQGLSS